MIEAEAYLIAHSRGVRDEIDLDDWFEIEQEINTQLSR
jgi:hypothetical protein